ncbi:maleylpyruvate isomerase family mycothiol-dependent enzyme [Sanguibacter antarcticus]|uniref:maleylpyruvate isomerase family mycothiol-dependent enzyme n=1 Tax=Sanguibacter antarcticus TaxID=372484 RepID=UPI0014759575|nr:maleylpyruvate isomerase family mycothiol-dependent enzyme [Sanguibacter antarcticus]
MTPAPTRADAEPPEAVILADVGELEDLLLEAVARFDDADVRAPSTLPGWSRGHVLAHLTSLATAFTRQAELASRGELGEVYDGGREERDAAIEAAAGRDAEEHLAHLEAALVRLSASWPDDSAGWAAPVTFRSGTLSVVLDAWWREVALHAIDLECGITAGAWSPEACERLWDFLSQRLPESAADIELVGAPRDVLLWLAGREPVHAPTARRAGAEVPLPELEPWPRRQPRTPSR